MAKVTFCEQRPKCRVCGTTSHVITVANPHSPQLGCCASCGMAARELYAWSKDKRQMDIARLIEVVLAARDAKPSSHARLRRVV